MGFFDKMKKLVGKTGVELSYPWIENPFPFGDPMIKATIEVTAESPITIMGTTGTFVAIRENTEGLEEELILGEETEGVDACASVDRNGASVPEFPHALGAGEKGSYGYFVGNMDLAVSLAKWGVTDAASAKAKGIRFVFKGEVDVKETVGVFDPVLEQAITVV
jgi:hypothetical protein